MGEVQIEMRGEKYTLRATRGAAKQVNAAFGGFSAAFRRVVENDLDAVEIIIAAGLDKKPTARLIPEGDDKTTVAEAVYETGLNTLADPAAKFIGFLSNGGRDPKEKEGGTGE